MDTSTTPIKNNSGLYIAIGIISVVVPGLIATLYYIPNLGSFLGIDVRILPHINAALNTATALALVIGYIFIRKGNWRAHRNSMITAFVFSSVFLISYVLYHSTAGHTYFGDSNGDGILSDTEKAEVAVLRGIYAVILLTHIVLAAIIVPFVLLSIYFGITKQNIRHKKISKWTFPMWLYVAISGVLVYLMISPYYQ